MSGSGAPAAVGAAGHLAALGSEPRPAGSAAESRARATCVGVLTSLGFQVREQPFTYSQWPGRWLVPLLGVLWVGTLVTAARFGVVDRGGVALLTLAIGGAAIALGARSLTGGAVLDLSLGRSAGANLVATRGGAPAVWLVAHLDSKSQPVSIATRMLGIVATFAVMAAVTVVAVAQTAGWRSADRARDVLVNVPHVHADLTIGLSTGGWLWVALTGLGLLAALPVVASTVGSRSPGALDNASGVATVLTAAALLPDDAPVGVVITSGEELGLAGARAFARAAAAGEVAGVRVAIDCDSIDDAGWTVAQWSARSGRPARVLEALGSAGAGAGVRVRPVRVFPGLLTDGVALAAAGWEVATVSRGTLGTLRRIHTRRDDLSRLRGEGAAQLAPIIARAAEGIVREARTG